MNILYYTYNIIYSSVLNKIKNIPTNLKEIPTALLHYTINI